ncbi:hypothetical protein XthCFBP4691_11305 [Xanthomonas theicola]|uniref:Mannose-1-phosphate guanyltransferase C-terminal domain-containing protein n=1 Tax=Xanthomonas theicola TaxID=56464 RepID=A0A2S6ZET1_9XANT|nr:hypothetical protein XthCFBP4691_11305 [Xanthomonas theicola]QNH27030.1 UDP-3-O-(3-hydroxymyristoyl)glucosamine N-acyltransferase [Xanthomonas theicola]
MRASRHRKGRCLPGHAWRQALPDQQLQRLEIHLGEDHSFDFSSLDAVAANNHGVFVAFDQRFGNFKRMELMQAAMERSWHMDPFIHPAAVVDSSAVIGMNTFIGPAVVIGHGCKIDYNTVIMSGTHIGHGSRIKPSCWIEHGAQLGAEVELGSNCTLHSGAVLQRDIKIGRGCELGWAQVYGRDIPARTIFDSRYDEPIHVYGQKSIKSELPKTSRNLRHQCLLLNSPQGIRGY